MGKIVVVVFSRPPPRGILFHRSPQIRISFCCGSVGWLERSEPHRQNLPKKWWGSLRSTHPTLGNDPFRNRNVLGS